LQRWERADRIKRRTCNVDELGGELRGDCSFERVNLRHKIASISIPTHDINRNVLSYFKFPTGDSSPPHEFDMMQMRDHIVARKVNTSMYYL